MADFFCFSSAKTMLTRVLPRWLEWHDEVRQPITLCSLPVLMPG